MNTPTPGAASELQALYCPFCAGLAQVEQLPESDKIRPLWWLCGCADADCLGMSHTPFERRGDAIRAWNTRTPAPVTEGAQREAVAWLRYRDYNGTRPTSVHVCNPDDDGAFAVCRLPPPPDRVQPERVEAPYMACDIDSLELHDDTKALVHLFAFALAEKLAAAEKKYGYGNDWQRAGWMDECREHLREHVEKGDPRDVAAYCAFLWHHNESTAAPPTDASGGVTADAIDRACAAVVCEGENVEFYLAEGADCGDDAATKAFAREIVRTIIEAADRARKPGYRQVTYADCIAIENRCQYPADVLFPELQHIGAVIPEHAPSRACVVCGAPVYGPILGADEACHVCMNNADVDDDDAEHAPGGEADRG